MGTTEHAVVFGAGGHIGLHVVSAFLARNIPVVGVVRSKSSAERVEDAGGAVVRASLAEPYAWASTVQTARFVVQLAADFGGDLESAENSWMRGLETAVHGSPGSTIVIYTGGIWLYGERTDPPIRESDEFEPMNPFGYMVRGRARLIASGFDTRTVHPGIVWSELGGPVVEMQEEALAAGKVVSPAELDTLWPMVHAGELAELYVLAALQGGAGEDYLGVAEPGVPFGSLLEIVERRTGRPLRHERVPVPRYVESLGAWAAGRARSQRVDARWSCERLGWAPVRRVSEIIT